MNEALKSFFQDRNSDRNIGEKRPKQANPTGKPIPFQPVIERNSEKQKDERKDHRTKKLKNRFIARIMGMIVILAFVFRVSRCFFSVVYCSSAL